MRNAATGPQSNLMRQSMQLEHRAPDRLVFLTRQFHRAMERQKQWDVKLEAGLIRIMRNPRIRQIVKQIAVEEN